MFNNNLDKFDIYILIVKINKKIKITKRCHFI